MCDLEIDIYAASLELLMCTPLSGLTRLPKIQQMPPIKHTIQFNHVFNRVFQQSEIKVGKQCISRSACGPWSLAMEVFALPHMIVWLVTPGDCVFRLLSTSQQRVGHQTRHQTRTLPLTTTINVTSELPPC